MNRYQQAVTEMDRRHRLIVRAVSFFGAGVVVVAVLWSVGLPPHKWFSGLWSEGGDSIVAVLPSQDIKKETLAVAIPQDTPIPAESPELLRSTASSVQSVPQPLLLVSTTPGRNKNEGTALIGIDARSPQTYVGGAILANGARLAEIHPDHVVLERGRDTLRLDLFVSGGRTARGLANGNRDLGMVGATALQPVAVIKPARGHISDVVRSMPYYENDLLVGLQLFPGRKSYAFAALGLSAGDVLTSVDGVPVADADAATAALAMLAEGATMAATIRRQGETKTVTLSGSVVTEALAPEQRITSAAPSS